MQGHARNAQMVSAVNHVQNPNSLRRAPLLLIWARRAAELSRAAGKRIQLVCLLPLLVPTRRLQEFDLAPTRVQGRRQRDDGAANPQYPCCSFRGSAVAINATTGAVIWKHYTAAAGYSGASVCGSSVIPDPLRGVVCITTGNNYSTPTASDFTTCVNGQPLTDAVVTECLSPDDLVNSVV
jgi:hypothetical protein